MVQLANDQNLKPRERTGGLVFDEMSIQEDISVTFSGHASFFTGQVDMGMHANKLRNQRQGK